MCFGVRKDFKMKIILKAFWHGKRVTVSISHHYEQDGFNRHFHMKIKVEEAYLLPNCFIRGATHKANMDIINTLGGFPKYVSKILDDAARREEIRRKTMIEEQLKLF